MSAESDEPTVPNEALVDRRRPGTPPDLVRDLILVTTALALAAACSVYDSLKHPGHGLTDLLLAVVCVLLAVEPWVSRPIGGKLASEPNWSFRRTWPLSLRFSCWGLSRSRMRSSRASRRRRRLAQRKEVWKQSMDATREAVELASKLVSDASRKGKEATEALNKTAVQIKLPDGKIEHRFDPEAFRQVEGGLGRNGRGDET